MSWDVMIQKFSRHYAAIAEIPNDEKCADLGPRAFVQAAVSQIFPETNWDYPAWGTWSSRYGSIEFNVGSDPVEGMMLHVRAGTEVVGGIIKLCRDNGWQGLDCGSGEFIELTEQAETGLLAWGAYRDQILASPNR